MHSLMIDVTVYIVKKTNLKRKCQNNFARTKQVLIDGVMDKKKEKMKTIALIVRTKQMMSND